MAMSSLQTQGWQVGANLRSIKTACAERIST